MWLRPKLCALTEKPLKREQSNVMNSRCDRFNKDWGGRGVDPVASSPDTYSRQKTTKTARTWLRVLFSECVTVLFRTWEVKSCGGIIMTHVETGAVVPMLRRAATRQARTETAGVPRRQRQSETDNSVPSWAERRRQQQRALLATS